MRNAVVAATLLVTSTALARPPVPAEFWDREAKLTLAQALVGEADWHRPDHEAIAHVLVKRWRAFRRNRPSSIPFTDFVKLYSAPLKTKEARARRIQALPWGTFAGPGDVSGERWVSWAISSKRAPGGWGGARWDRVRKLVTDWGRGRVKDPCPRAIHWGGTMDRPTATMSPVNCGPTRNIFYRVRAGARTGRINRQDT
jgi:hypothetical protein